jgi:carbon monoxide dehydrogenase subunit G
MAHYVTTVPSRLSPAEAFAFMADIERFVEWDPGITKVEKRSGKTGETGAAYDLTIAGWSPTVMRYEVTAVDAPRSFRMASTTRFLRSLDEIRIEADGAGSRVTYDARLELRGPLRVFDPVLARVFQRIADRAVAGLRKALA